MTPSGKKKEVTDRDIDHLLTKLLPALSHLARPAQRQCSLVEGAARLELFLSFIYLLFYVYKCSPVYTFMYHLLPSVPRSQKRALDSPRTGVTEGGELPCFWFGNQT